MPQLSLTGQSIDENNTLESYRGRGFLLEDEVEIFADDSYQGYQPGLFSFESNESSFNEVDWGGLSIVESDGKTLVMPGEEDNYTITFSFTDESNNTGFAALTVVAKDPAWTIQGRRLMDTSKFPRSVSSVVKAVPPRLPMKRVILSSTSRTVSWIHSISMEMESSGRMKEP